MDNIINNEKIIERSVSKEMKNAYMDYAMSVIISRALPNAKDGLKPVHRRILYSMYEENLTYNKPFRKSATTVGNVLGNYHPHGDSSVYDAMVRLAQDFSMRYRLIDGHGNFGSIDGDPAAAYRYTEARMQKITDMILADIDKDTVDQMPNFDDSKKEPVVLPTRIPNLLINGSSGIAVGMATNMPSHNLKEVINATIMYIENNDVTISDLMTHIKGPDFPTGAMIMGYAPIKEAYETGKGKLKIRGEAIIEEMANNKRRIIINSLPYQVNKAKLIEDIADLAKNKKIEGISDIRDESDRNAQVRVVIEIKRDANAQVILNQLYKHTQLQTTFGVINLALVDNEPRILTLKECIEIFVDHRKDVVIRRTKFDLAKAMARLHILEGLKIAIENIDEVIKIIRSSYNDAKEKLMKRFNLSDIQAQSILDMRLKTLEGLQIEKIIEEYNKLLIYIDELNLILNSSEKLLSVIKEELIEVRDKFGDERRTKIVANDDDIDVEDLIKEEQTVVTLTHFGYIKRMPVDTYKSQKRGGKGIIGINTKEEDFVKEIFTASTHDYILFFTNKGRLHQLKGYDIPEASRTARGTAIVNLLSLDPDEKISTVIPIKKYREDQYLLMATKNGMIKKTALKEYDSVRKVGLNAIALVEGDNLINVRLTDGSHKVMIITNTGMSIAFEETDVRETGRNTQGVRGIKLKNNAEVIGMETFKNSNDKTLLAITENGFGKRTELEEYNVQKRGGSGVITYKISKKTGNIVGTRIVDGSEDLMLITNEGTIIRIDVAEISVLGRSTMGVTLIRTTEEAKVVSLETVEKQESLDDSEEE